MGHFRRYRRKELEEKLQKAGFEIREIRYWNCIGLIPYVFQKIFKVNIDSVRYSSKNQRFAKFVNSGLDFWFRLFENNIKMPFGLSLIAVGVKKGKIMGQYLTLLKKRYGIKKLCKYAIYFTLYGIVKYIPSPIGDYLRYFVLKAFLKKLGKGTIIKEGVTIYFPENVEIGENVTINEFCFIDGYGGVRIGNFVRIAHGVSIISEDHGFSVTNKPIYLFKKKSSPVNIGNDVWIGCKATILKGVSVGKGCVIGANSVVVSDIPEHSVAVGCPARVVRKRV